MLTRDDRLVAAGHSADPVRWAGILDELMTQVGARFRRVEPRRRARALVVGLLAGLPRKNCWTIAEHAGDATPDGMQHLLARAKWDADGMRDDVRGYVAEHLGDPRAVLVVDGSVTYSSSRISFVILVTKPTAGHNRVMAWGSRCGSRSRPAPCLRDLWD